MNLIPPKQRLREFAAAKDPNTGAVELRNNLLKEAKEYIKANNINIKDKQAVIVVFKKQNETWNKVRNRSKRAAGRNVLAKDGFLKSLNYM